jgi:uncharacterized protein YjlB
LNSPDIKFFYLHDDGMIPNNKALPVLLYPGVLRGREEQTERVFNRHSWLNSWVNGVFAYHHYHSNSHEVLGVMSGSAALQIGGEQGEEINVVAGDVIVLPAGTGHKRLASSADFKVAGAYPNGMDYNLKTGKDGERPGVLEDIRNVPIPDKDPVYGVTGPLIELWKEPQKMNKWEGMEGYLLNDAELIKKRKDHGAG